MEQAQSLARERGLHNVSFAVQDCRHLDFGDNSFDLTYSHALMEHVTDPVLALQEQRRVTRSGGAVCAMMANHSTTMMHPLFPSLQRWFECFPLWADPKHPATFQDRFVGRKSVELFTLAGLPNVTLRSMEPRLWWAGQPTEPFPGMLVIGWFLTSEHYADFRTRLVQLGCVNEWTIGQAGREWQAWLNHPHALYMQVNICAVARVEK